MRFQLVALSLPAATGLVAVVMCGCVTVTGVGYDSRPCYGHAPIRPAAVPWPPRVPPHVVAEASRDKAAPARIYQQQRPVRPVPQQAYVQYRQVSREPTQSRPPAVSYDYVEHDRIVLPREYVQGSRNGFTNEDVARLTVFYERVYGVDRFLIAAVMKAESDFDPYAVSPAGARGIMQLMPETARSLGVANSFDPAQNIAGGTLYLAMQLRAFNGNLSLALAAYNAGPEAVRRHGGIPPYRETQDFVQRVTFYYRHYAGR
jgi:soluble lytic murein transglycosylase-like protein